MTARTVELQARALAMGLELSDETALRLEQYAEEVSRWSARLNLTTATTEEIVGVHVLDALLPLVVWPIQDGTRIIDVGSGAGLPGIPIAIVRRHLLVTLVESSRRRVAFLEHLRRVLALEHIDIVWARAEALAHQPEYREQFACAVERAAARVAQAAELCLPFVALGGAAVLIKGPSVIADLPGLAPLIDALGGRVQASSPRRLAGGRTSVPVVIAKHRSTPPEFPRRDTRLGRLPGVRSSQGRPGS